ncbi:proteasome subunit beta [Candidatus Woesearchaeota archaeon]|nr:proteasome subunit beta [Candidatus Woesearchaeota archaeon]MBW3017944.1 proteasome subunit beta [Candidatus Woesearchaeota archaeon]
MVNEESQKLKTGTTTVGIVCTDGVVLGADMRATAGGMIIQKDVEKIVPITDKIALTTAGNVSDIQLLVKLIKAELKLKEVRTGQKPSVKAAANLLGNMVYQTIRQPFFPGIAHFILAGADDEGIHLYDLFPDGSVNHYKDYVTTGSGMVFTLGVLEAEYKKDMTIADGVKLVKKAISASLQRDAYSGEGILLYTITQAGAKKHSEKRIPRNIE